jgi:NADH-quinone oxidoreductase subunit A
MDVATVVFTAFLLVGIVLAVALVTLPRWLAPRSSNEHKAEPYECGENPIGEPWVRFRVGYYVFALMFVVFDVEAVFLYPWAVLAKQLGLYGLIEMIVFLSILALGLAYAWRKGVLKWQ